MRVLSLTEKRIIAGVYLAVIMFCAANQYFRWNLFGAFGKKILSVVIAVGILCIARYGPAMLKEIEDYRASQKQKGANNAISGTVELGDKAKQLQTFNWRGFALFAIIVLGTAAYQTLPLTRENLGPDSAVLVFCISLICFYGYRWHRLRVGAKDHGLTSGEFWRHPSQHLRGPLKPFLIWFVATFITVAAVAILFS